MEVSLEGFYEVLTTFSFTLMGLWWAVVQFHYEEWVKDKRYRRMAHSVHYSFFIPGLMGLGSMLTGENPFIWRLTFILAGGLGVVAALSVVDAVRTTSTDWTIQATHWVAIALYLFIILVALAPDVIRGIGLHPLQAEGLLLSILVFLGVNFAWEFMVATRFK